MLTLGGKNNLSSSTDKVGKWTLTVWAEGQGYCGSITSRGEWLRKSQTGWKHISQINIWVKVYQEKVGKFSILGTWWCKSLYNTYIFLFLFHNFKFLITVYKRDELAVVRLLKPLHHCTKTICSLTWRIPRCSTYRTWACFIVIVLFKDKRPSSVSVSACS